MYNLVRSAFLLGLIMIGIGVYFAIGLRPKDYLERRIKAEQSKRSRIFEIFLGITIAGVGAIFVFVSSQYP